MNGLQANASRLEKWTYNSTRGPLQQMTDDYKIVSGSELDHTILSLYSLNVLSVSNSAHS